MAKEKETKTAKKTAKTETKVKKAPAKKEVTKKVTAKKAVEKPVKAAKPTKVEKVAKTEVAAPKKTAKPKTEAKEDTGSVDFQIGNFSDKIKSLAKHLKTHPHDFDSRRGLLIMVGKRRRLLNYLKKSDLVKYEEAVKALKLKS